MDFPPLELVRVACVPACAYTIQKVRNDFGAEWNARRKDHAAAVLLGLRESSKLSARILTTSKKPHKLQYNIFRTINRYEYVGKPRGHGHPVMAMLRNKKAVGRSA